MHVLSGWGLAAHLTEQAPLCATLLLTALIVSAVASLAWCVEKLVYGIQNCFENIAERIRQARLRRATRVW